jgi:flagellar motility protein MotE (MotC chaperone)
MTVRGGLVAVAMIGIWWVAGAGATNAAPESVVAERPGDDGLQRLLEDVRRRGAEIERRERELVQRAAALESLEQAVGEALSDLEVRDGGGTAGSCRLRGGVTRIYESMRPDEAAQILDQLDDETLRVVFARMDAKQIAAIMASMSRERAVAFTKTLAADPEPTAARTASVR